MIRKTLSIAGILALAASTLLADFSYQESSKITGGMMAGMMKVAGVFSKDAREPMVSSIAVKGDRMVRRAKDHVEILDLNSETITAIDMQKKTYSVVTFAQMKQAMEEAMQKLQASKNKNSNADLQFKVSASATGNTKNIAGFDAKEMMIKIAMEGADQKTGEKGAMVVTNRVWIAANVPGYAELRDFQKRMATKLAWTPGSNMFMADPKMAQGMAEAYKEISKLDGAPVLTLTSMGAEGTAPADGAAPAAQPQQQQETRKPTIGGALGGALGGRFGRKKPEPSQAPASEGAPAGGSASLMDLTTEASNFSTASVESGLFEVPAGFKKVDSPMLKGK